MVMTEKDFSLRLAKLREEKGVSARDMSLSMGPKANELYSIARGLSDEQLDNLIALAKGLRK